jgi:peroxiredoxin
MNSIARLTLVVCLSAAAFAQPAVPRPANDFRTTTASGKPLNLADSRGKVVVMQFLYTTCVHCQETARMLSRLQQELGPRGLQVMGVAFDPQANEKAGEFVASNHVNFPVGTASLDDVLGYLGISVMDRFVVPQIVIVDRNGSIRAQSKPQGTPELQSEDYLRQLLGSLLDEHMSARNSRPRPK